MPQDKHSFDTYDISLCPDLTILHINIGIQHSIRSEDSEIWRERP